MAIITDSKAMPPPPPVILVSSPPVVEEIKYDAITVDTKITPSSALLTHVEGARWTVEWFGQILTNDTALAGQMVTIDPIYQQYRLIQQMELRVTTPLTTSQDTVTKSLNITGSANVYGFVLPNEGDMFIAALGDGRDGIFRISLSERKSVFKDTIHAIEYKLIDYSTAERKTDLMSKVVDTYVFSKDFLTYGQNPLIRKADHDIINKLQGYYNSLSKHYFETYVSNEYKTLLIPGQDKPIYDHFLTKFIKSIFTANDISTIRDIRLMNLDDDDLMKSTTLWDMLKEKDVSMFKYCVKKVGLISSRSFTQNPMMEGIYHSGINYVLYPKEYNILTVDSQTKLISKPLSGEVLVDKLSPITDLVDLVADINYQSLSLPRNPIIRPVLVDDSYILSSFFYSRDRVNMTILELLVMDYLENKAIDNISLLNLCETAHAWGILEQYYYTIIVLVLIKYSTRTV